MVADVTSTGITVKKTASDENHVKIGVLITSFYVGGRTVFYRDNEKPHSKYTIQELMGLLDELRSFEIWRC